MTEESQKHPEFCRFDLWEDCDGALPLLPGRILPEDCFFPEEGIPQSNADRYFVYRFDLMLEAESALRSFLGLLVGFRQKRKLAQFLLGFCDLLEVTIDTGTGALQECRFRIDFSDGVSLGYSSRICGCMILLDGKEDTFHRISPYAIDDLRRLLSDIWEKIHGLPVWETVARKDNLTTLRCRMPMS